MWCVGVLCVHTCVCYCLQIYLNVQWSLKLIFIVIFYKYYYTSNFNRCQTKSSEKMSFSVRIQWIIAACPFTYLKSKFMNICIFCIQMHLAIYYLFGIITKMYKKKKLGAITFTEVIIGFIMDCKFSILLIKRVSQLKQPYGNFKISLIWPIGPIKQLYNSSVNHNP